MGKQEKQRTLPVLLLILLLVLSACEGSPLHFGQKNPEDILERSREAVENIQSLHYDTVLELSLTAQDQTMDMTTTTAVDYITSPAAMKLDFSVSLGEGSDTADTTLYLVAENGIAAMYMGTDEGSGMQWTREEVELEELERYDAVSSLNLYLSKGTDLVQGENEVIAGKETLRFDGVVAREDIEAVLHASGMLETLGQLDLSDGSTALAELESLPLSLWIEAETYYPVKCELDMTPLLKLLMKQSFAGQLEGVQITRAVGSTTVGKIDAVAPIQPPSLREVVRGKCMHPDCTRDQAASGSSRYCSIHSATCLNCGRYIDEGELFCSSCSSRVLSQAQEDSRNSETKKNGGNSEN